MYQVTMEEAGTAFPQLEQAMRSGEEVFITENSFAVAKIVPIPPPGEQIEPLSPRKPGSAKGLIHMRDDFDDPLEDFAEYM